MRPLILTSTPESAPEPDAPRQDFRLLTQMLGGTLSYPPKTGANSLLARVEKKTAADLRQAFAALKMRREVSVYVSLSEKVGVPLALLLPKARRGRPAHVLIAHHLTSSNKRKLQQRTGYVQRFDHVVALGSTQARYLKDEVGYPLTQTTQIRHAVDAKFWTPQSLPPPDAPYIVSVGRERRDYETLAKALALIPETRSIVVASSPWSRQAGQAPTQGEAPANMEFRRGLSYPELRTLYARAEIVVVPLETGTAYAAGATGVLEALAMGKPTLVTETPGLTDYRITDSGEPVAATVPGSDGARMAAAIQSLLGDRAKREHLAIVGRRFVESCANVDDYVAAVAGAVRKALAG